MPWTCAHTQRMLQQTWLMFTYRVFHNLCVKLEFHIYMLHAMAQIKAGANADLICNYLESIHHRAISKTLRSALYVESQQ